jgi:hypothetical protein
MRMLLIGVWACMFFIVAVRQDDSCSAILTVSDVKAATLYGSGSCAWKSTSNPTEWTEWCGSDGACDVVMINIVAGSDIKLGGYIHCGSDAGCGDYPDPEEMESCSGGAS